MAVEATPPGLYSVSPEGVLTYHFHTDQDRAWLSTARIVAVTAGTQGGKTTFGPLWLLREIGWKGAGDYIVATPDYPLLQLKALPEFLRLFEQYLALGTYNKTDRVFTFSPEGERRIFGAPQEVPTNIFFGHANDPESLEAATAKAAWLDEAGQKDFKLESWEAIRRRVAIHEGRILVTTTWYNLGWLKVKIWDAWKAGDPEIEVIRFPSIANPAFPRAEYERARRDLPAWKFALFYEGIPTRPAGLIYDNFDADRHTIPRHAIPHGWPRYVGVDFGGVNTVGLFYARDTTHPEVRRFVLYGEYGPGHRRISKEHARRILQACGPTPMLAIGGSKSEHQWRRDFRSGGLAIKGPKITDVEVGIDRVYGFHARDELFVFDDLSGYLSEKGSYSRKLDKKDGVTVLEEIEDKSRFHFMDAERYILSRLAPEPPRKAPRPRSHSSRNLRV